MCVNAYFIFLFDFIFSYNFCAFSKFPAKVDNRKIPTHISVMGQDTSIEWTHTSASAAFGHNQLSVNNEALKSRAACQDYAQEIFLANLKPILPPPIINIFFDSVFNENNKSYTLGLSSRSKNKDGGVGLSMYNLYETSNGVTKDLGPAVQTVGTGKRLTAKQPYKTKNKKNARIILELIKG